MTRKTKDYDKLRHRAEMDLTGRDRNPQQDGPKNAAGCAEKKYEVGYGRPPKHSQVKEGQILNPNGRPNGSKNKPKPTQDFYNTILEEAHREVPQSDGSGEPMTMERLIVRATNVSAAKGNTHAQRLAADMIRVAYLEKARQRDQEIGAALEYKRAWGIELQRRKNLGLNLPDPLPHPDHVVINLVHGCVQICGPATPQESLAFVRWRQWRLIWVDQLRDLKERRTRSAKKMRGVIENKVSDVKLCINVADLALEGNRHALEFLENGLQDAKRKYPDEDLFDDEDASK